MSSDARQAVLHLSHGAPIKGRLIGAPLTSRGELVFTTSLVGYSESLSDPSYFGQILTFSYPLIGNYGIPHPQDHHHLLPARGYESRRIHAAGVVVTVASPRAFHWNSFFTLDQWLKKQGVPGIAAIDTRHLITRIREHYPLLGRLEPEAPQGERTYPDFTLPPGDFFDASEHQILPQVSTSEPVVLRHSSEPHAPHVVLIDCGVKSHILRMLLDLGCTVEVVPWDSDLTSLHPQGWVISNGPGDPMQATSLIAQISSVLLQQDRPVLGICLGHQLLGIAAGISSERMAYGHRSHNQPVLLEGTRTGYITSQNHGFHLVENSHWPEQWLVWFRNANDASIEGIRHESRPFRSVQFHPESSGGPRDTAWILKQFVEEISPVSSTS